MYAGSAPLHLAVQSRSIGCVEELLKTGVDVDVQHRNNGRTALHLAVDLDDMNICIPLIAEVSYHVVYVMLIYGLFK